MLNNVNYFHILNIFNISLSRYILRAHTHIRIMNKNRWIICVIILVISFCAMTGLRSVAFSASENSLLLTICERGDILFQKSYTLNPEFEFNARGRESEIARVLAEGFDEVELADYLYGSLGRDIDELFDKVDEIKLSQLVEYRGEGRFHYFPERSGLRVDRGEFFERLFESVGKEALRVEIKRTQCDQRYGLDELRSCTERIASYSTSYQYSPEGRKHNIALASKFLSGRVIESGEVLSFNQVVGKRTTARGFREAKVIQEGKYSDGVGGGVCQVATTLYNATLRAGLTTVSCSRHTLAPSYVPLSFDAMVSDHTDLKIRNDRAFPVFLELIASGERLTVNVYGKKSNEEYRFVSETVEVVHFEGEDIEENAVYRDGYKSRGYKLVYKDGKLVRRILLREDVYKPYRVAQ